MADGHVIHQLRLKTGRYGIKPCINLHYMSNLDHNCE
jgi:hypothetical protein